MKIKQRIFELIVLAMAFFFCVAWYKIFTANQRIVEPWFKYGQNNDVCYKDCDVSIYNSCIGTEDPKMCIKNIDASLWDKNIGRNLVY